MKKKIISILLVIVTLLGATIVLTGCGNKEEKDGKDSKVTDLKTDEISGYSYVEKDDNSLLTLNSDKTFKYYKDKTDLTDYYYEGTYKVFKGDEAIKYISNDLSSYGLTKTELDDLIRKDTYKKEEFCCLVLTNNKCIMNGENVQKEPNDAPYMGYYSEDETLYIMNMNSFNFYSFEKQK